MICLLDLFECQTKFKGILLFIVDSSKITLFALPKDLQRNGYLSKVLTNQDYGFAFAKSRFEPNRNSLGDY